MVCAIQPIRGNLMSFFKNLFNNLGGHHGGGHGGGHWGGGHGGGGWHGHIDSGWRGRGDIRRLRCRPVEDLLAQRGALGDLESNEVDERQQTRKQASDKDIAGGVEQQRQNEGADADFPRPPPAQGHRAVVGMRRGVRGFHSVERWSMMVNPRRVSRLGHRTITLARLRRVDQTPRPVAWDEKAAPWHERLTPHCPGTSPG